MSRKYWLVVGLSVVAVVVLSYFFSVVGAVSFGLVYASIWLTIIMAVVWGVVWVLRRANVTRRGFRLRSALRLPLLLFLMGATGILFANIYAPAALPSADLPADEQMHYLAKTDRDDRFAVRFLKLEERDRERRQRADELLAQDGALSPESIYLAAVIFQHGNETADYERAYDLSRQADEAGYPNDFWKLAYDRWMLSIGEPQLYGTQYDMQFDLFGLHSEQR